MHLVVNGRAVLDLHNPLVASSLSGGRLLAI